MVSARITLVAKAAYASGLGRRFFKGHTLNTFDIDIYIYFYVKPKTIVYYHLRQCHMTNNNILFRYGKIPESQSSVPRSN